MKKDAVKNVKVRCIKQSLPRFDGVVKTYSPLQPAAVKSLSDNSDFESIACNAESITVVDKVVDYIKKKYQAFWKRLDNKIFSLRK